MQEHRSPRFPRAPRPAAAPLDAPPPRPVKEGRRLSAQEAYDKLKTLLRTAYRRAERGEGSAHLVPAAVYALSQLDLHLTGKANERKHDEEHLRRVLCDFESYVVHLSDGGYSRLVLCPSDLFVGGTGIGLHRDVSLPRAIRIWETIRK